MPTALPATIPLTSGAPSPQDLDRQKLEIKQRFADIPGDWKEVLVTKIYKLEEYRF